MEQLRKGILEVFGPFEQNLVRVRTRGALQIKKAKGERLGKLPFGFRTAADGVHMEEDPTEQVIIARVRHLRGTGMTLWGIVDECRQNGFVSRAGKPLGLTQIARLLMKGQST